MLAVTQWVTRGRRSILGHSRVCSARNRRELKSLGHDSHSLALLAVAGRPPQLSQRPPSVYSVSPPDYLVTGEQS